MREWEPLFAGKRITVMGLGLLGRGVGDAEFLVQAGARVTVTDSKGADELAPSFERLAPYDITLHLGGHHIEDFTDTDMVIKGAGVPLDSPFVAAARNADVPVYMSTALFAREVMRAGIRVIGVTGTRGKSTISYLIHRTLAHAGVRSWYGGNVRGVSTLAFLPLIEHGDAAVLELDSWQLQGFGDLAVSPNIAVFSNFLPDHLNYYPSMDAYFADKAHIFRYQKDADVLIAGSSVIARIEAEQPPRAPIVPEPLPLDWNIVLPGAHNRENIALAVAALRAAGTDEQMIRSCVISFRGLEGRLQLLSERHGIRIYNDNNATTPAATVAAIKSFPPEKTHVIMGGSDKGLDTTELASEAQRVKSLTLLKGSGSERFRATHAAFQAHPLLTLEEAFERAKKNATHGDIILFSPGFASFGPPPGGFKNEYDRNDQFLAIVGKM